MLFCEKARTGKLAQPTGASDADRPRTDGAHRPDTAHGGRIRLGGGCRLPFQGEPKERDRPRRRILGQEV
jgi:hypothetical protein